MANDKDFIVKNAVEVGGSTKTTLGTVTNDNIDLSTGNYFAHSPAGVTTYTISNAATNQSFQLEVTGGAEEVAQNFSTTLYTGNGSTQTITNGIDLANDGGLVWIKGRNAVSNHALVDTERGGANSIASDTTAAERTDGAYGVTFNSNGFDSTGGNLNISGREQVAWTFKKAAGFFDVVVYDSSSGNTTNFGSAGATVDHNLGSVPGMIIVKCTDTGATNWKVYHRGLNGGTNPEQYEIELNQTGGEANSANSWNNTAPTSTQFTLGVSGDVNNSSRSYVAYLFAHDTASDGLIQCGSFVNDLSSVNVEVNLGWKPQWLLIKGASSGSGLGHWYIYDNSRTGQVLSANQSAAESADTSFTLTSNGFTPTTNFNGTLIYIAIRSAADLDLTWPTSIEWAGGVAPAAPATGETDLFSISTDDGGTTYQGFKVADNLS